ncbi:hypothetical protein F511_05404 [Dorcoceras hygrometricum]|uniref:Uncharacterized protein n=1 Tax=Dorcoceras hygrometricum TaxID=472368 RepID=A0A2Z7BMW5_9LAMI|nr:hypothetical protein F511_05404 [Dorcoceras hygrometricum]
MLVHCATNVFCNRTLNSLSPTALALLFSTADCDDITADVIIAGISRKGKIDVELGRNRFFGNRCQPWTVMDSQIIDLLSAAHSKSLEELLAQQQEHGIIMDRPSSSQSVDDSAAGSGAVLAQFFSLPDPPAGVIQHSSDTNSFVGYFNDSVVQSELQSISDIELLSSDDSTVYRSPSPQLDSFQEADSTEPNVQLALALVSTVSVVDQDEQLYTVQIPDSSTPIFQRSDSSSSAADSSLRFNSDDISLENDTTHFSDSFADLMTSLSQFISNQTKATRRIDDAQNDVLSKLNTLEKDIFAALKQHEEANRTMIQSARQEARTQKKHVRKEQKNQRAMIEDLDRQVDKIWSELFDFRAKAEENYLNLSTQLGDLVDYIRGGDAKKGEGSSSRPQPPPDDQDRPTGEGSANREAGIRCGELGGDGRNRGGSGSSGSQRRSERGGSSKRRRSSGDSLVRNIRYGPYPPDMLPGYRFDQIWVLRQLGYRVRLFNLSDQLFGLSGQISTVQGTLEYNRHFS